MRRENESPLGMYTIGIAALFLAGFFLLVVFGAQCYRDAVSSQSGNMHSRALLSYLSTTLKGYDRRDAVRLETSDYGPVLVVEEKSGGYALRIYRYEGKLVEDYAAEDAALNPENAQTIGTTERFELQRDGDVLTLDTDAGRVLIHLRSEGGGAA